MPGTALVIGGAGFLGTGIVRQLQEAGWSITSLGRGNKSNQVAGVEMLLADRDQPGALAGALEGRTFPLVEGSPKERERPYGAGKVACEAVLEQAHQERAFPCTTLRPPHIMGAGK